MDKKSILQEWETALRREIEQQKIALASIHDAAIEAPGRMESRYDTTKTEMSWLADGLNQRLSEMHDLLQAVRQISAAPRESVGEGALVSCQRGDRRQCFLIIAGGAGKEIKTPDGSVTCMSPSAPLCQQLLGLSVGETASFRKEELVILGIA